MNTYIVGMEHLAIFTLMKRLHVPKSYYNHIQFLKRSKSVTFPQKCIYNFLKEIKRKSMQGLNT